MGLNNPSSGGVNPWPSGNTSQTGEKVLQSFASGSFGILAGSQLASNPDHPITVSAPNPELEQTISIPFFEIADPPASGDIILVSNKGGVRACEVVSSTVSGDTTLVVKPVDSPFAGPVYYGSGIVQSIHITSPSTVSYTNGSNVEGMNSIVIAGSVGCHAEGVGVKVGDEQNPTYGAHAEGIETHASSHASHAEGFGSLATGGYSHAEGDHTESSGISSHAQGQRTKAVGQASHAEGFNTIASAGYSHAGGRSSKARMMSSFVRAAGSFNISNPEYDAQDIIGPVFRGESIDENEIQLVSDGHDWLPIPYGATWAFSLQFVAMRTDAPGSASYRLDGVADNLDGLAVIRSTTKTVIHEDTAGYDVSLSVATSLPSDNLSSGFYINSTGASGHTVRWVCTSRIAEVIRGNAFDPLIPPGGPPVYAWLAGYQNGADPTTGSSGDDVFSWASMENVDGGNGGSFAIEGATKILVGGKWRISILQSVANISGGGEVGVPNGACSIILVVSPQPDTEDPPNYGGCALSSGEGLSGSYLFPTGGGVAIDGQYLGNSSADNSDPVVHILTKPVDGNWKYYANGNDSTAENVSADWNGALFIGMPGVAYPNDNYVAIIVFDRQLTDEEVSGYTAWGVAEAGVS